jgi:HPt (histidine-containing phosphotransfer) domain-containing protein
MRHTENPPPSDGHFVPKELPSSNALDYMAAIELLDNSTKLYLEVVQGYFQDIAGLAARLDILLRKADLQEAARTLHTCKGASLTVGANLMSEVCRQCEVQLKALRQSGKALDDATRQDMQVALEQAVGHTRQAIAEVLESLGTHTRTNGARALVEDLMSLRNLLVRSDMRAVARHKVLCAQHIAAVKQLQPLTRSLDIFDFAQAVVQCDELISDFSAPQ